MRLSISNKNFQYLLASDQDKLYGLYATTIGFQHIALGELYRPKGHPKSYLIDPIRGRQLTEFQIIYIINGSGYLETKKLKKTIVEAGSLILLFPGEWHHYFPLVNGWDVYWLGFSGSQANHWLKHNFISDKHPVTKVGIDTALVALFQNAQSLAKQQQKGYQQHMAGLIHHIISFFQFVQLQKSIKNKNTTAYISQAKALLTCIPSLHPEQVATRLNMGYSWFRRIFSCPSKSL